MNETANLESRPPLSPPDTDWRGSGILTLHHADGISPNYGRPYHGSTHQRWGSAERPPHITRRYVSPRVGRPARHSASQCNTPQPPDPRKCHQRPRPREPVDTPSWGTAVTQSGIAMEGKTVQTADPIMAIASLPISPNEPDACALADCDSVSKHHDSWRCSPRGRSGASPDPSLGATTTSWPPLRRPETAAQNPLPPPCRTRFSRRPSPPTNGSRQEALLATQYWEPEGELGARNQTSRGIKMRLLDRC